MSKAKSLLIVFIAYLVAFVTSIVFLNFLDFGIILNVLCLDIIATIIIYMFSVYCKNSSIYDPYWSVVPPFLLFYYINFTKAYGLESFILMFSVMFWSCRLTFNWMRSWPGMHKEDWRYVDMRKYSGRFFELSNFSGIHLFPTLIVFICCIPMKDAILKESLDLSFILGFVICFIGVVYEIISDQQLHNFKKNNTGIINSGLWKYSRHPNYYGEILFWWGIYIYGITIENYYIYILFPLLMTAMFVYVSIPWIENKILRTRKEYKEYQSKVSVLFPELSFFKSFFKS